MSFTINEEDFHRIYMVMNNAEEQQNDAPNQGIDVFIYIHADKWQAKLVRNKFVWTGRGVIKVKEVSKRDFDGISDYLSSFDFNGRLR